MVDRSSMGGSKPKPRHPLILDGLCLHVLSSFQRTGGPGRPEPRRKSFPANTFQRKHPSEGEPYEFTISSTVCQSEMGVRSPIWISAKLAETSRMCLAGAGTRRPISRPVGTASDLLRYAVGVRTSTPRPRPSEDLGIGGRGDLRALPASRTGDKLSNLHVPRSSNPQMHGSLVSRRQE